MVKPTQPFRRPQALRKGTHIRGMDRIPSKMKQPIRSPRKPKYIIDRRKETVIVFNLLGQVVHDHKRNHRPKFAKKEYKAVDSIVSCFIIYDNLRRYLLKWDRDFEEAEELLKTIAHDIHFVEPTLRTVIASHLFSKRKIKAANINSIVEALGFGNDITRDVQNIVSSSGTIIGIFNKLLKETREGEDARFEPAKEAYEALQEIFQRTISEEEIEDLVKFLETATTEDMEQEARDAFTKKRRRAGLLLSLVFAFMMGCSTGQDMAPPKPKYETSWVLAPIPLQSSLYDISNMGLYTPHRTFEEPDTVLCEGPHGQRLIVHDAIEIEKEGGVNFTRAGNGDLVSVEDSLSYENLNLMVLEFGQRLAEIRARNITKPEEEAKQIMQGIWQLLEDKGRLYDSEATLTIGTAQNDTLKVDCDMGSLIYVSIGQAYHLPIFLVILPRHVFVRWDSNHPSVAKYGFPRNIRFNWETTNPFQEIRHKIRSDEYYRVEYGLSKRQATGGPIYMNSMDSKNIQSLLYWNIALETYGRNSPSALDYVNQSIRVFPQNSEAYWLRGTILESMSHYAKTDSILGVWDVSRTDSTNLDSVKQSHSTKIQGLLDEARQSYQRALEFDPDMFKAYDGIAKIFLDQGRFQDAIQNYSTAVDSGGEFTYKYLCKRGQTYGRFAAATANKPEADSLRRQAIADFSASLKLIRDNDLYNFDEGCYLAALRGRGMYRLALGDLGWHYTDEDIESLSRRWSRGEQGVIDYISDRGAIGDFLAVVKFVDRSPNDHFMLATAVVKLNHRPVEAIPHFRAALAKGYRPQEKIYLEMGKALIRSGWEGPIRYTQAVRELSKIKKPDPRYGEAQFLIGRAYWESRRSTYDYDKMIQTERLAIAYWDRALRNNYDRPGVHRAMIEARIQLNEFKKALQHINVLIEQSPDDIQLKLQRAETTRKLLDKGVDDESERLQLLQTATQDYVAYFEANTNAGGGTTLNMGKTLVEYSELIAESNSGEARRLCRLVVSNFNRLENNWYGYRLDYYNRNPFYDLRARAKTILGDPSAEQDREKIRTRSW